ncbi:MAG: hypothetical protein ACP5P4_13600 [Steroidobacteraceae bacterium]
MATAGASALAVPCGLAPLMRPLLGLAVLQAVWISVRALGRHCRGLRIDWRAWRAVGPAHECCGAHTVPLGLAVITSDVLALGTTATRGPLWLAEIFLVMVWVTSVIAVGRFTGSLAARGFDLHRLDGTWFLVPAVLFGAGIATDRLAAQLAGHWFDALRLLAAGSTFIGAFGYWMLIVLAGLRIRLHGLGDPARVSWWIAMGCAGLGAAALGQVLQQRPSAVPAQWLLDATAMSLGAALLLCVPVLLLSAWFLLRQCEFRATASWPPTFSTAVLALGAFQAGRVLHLPALGILGLGAAEATLIFWSVTVGWNLRCAYSAWSTGAHRS